MFFFLFVQNKKESRKLHEAFFSSLTFVLFWTFIFFFMPQEVGGFLLKKSCKLTIGTSSFCRNLFPEEWFFLSAKLMQSFSIFIYCAKSQKKSLFWKKLVFPSISLFSRTAFISFTLLILLPNIIYAFFMSLSGYYIISMVVFQSHYIPKFHSWGKDVGFFLMLAPIKTKLGWSFFFVALLNVNDKNQNDFFFKQQNLQSMFYLTVF